MIALEQPPQWNFQSGKCCMTDLEYIFICKSMHSKTYVFVSFRVAKVKLLEDTLLIGNNLVCNATRMTSFSAQAPFMSVH